MKKFAELHANDGIELALEAARVMVDARCYTLAQVIAKRGCTPRDLWREICAGAGYDECEPWHNWPEPPKRDFLKNAPGVDRPAPERWQKLLDFWKRTFPNKIGQQRH